MRKRRGQREDGISWAIAGVVMLIVCSALMPLVVEAVNYVNLTALQGSAGYQATKTMLGLLPFVMIIGFIVYFLGKMLDKL